MKRIVENRRLMILAKSQGKTIWGKTIKKLLIVLLQIVLPFNVFLNRYD